jgi:hypothetical protein
MKKVGHPIPPSFFVAVLLVCVDSKLFLKYRKQNFDVVFEQF